MPIAHSQPYRRVVATISVALALTACVDHSTAPVDSGVDQHSAANPDTALAPDLAGPLDLALPDDLATALDLAAAVDSALAEDLVVADDLVTIDATTLTADLSLTMGAAPMPVLVDGTITYTITPNNAGPSDATAITVTAVLPAGVTYQSASGLGWGCGAVGQQVTCTRPTLTLGAGSPITVTALAPSSAGSIMATATIGATTSDPASGNNAATASVDVIDGADLSLTADAALDPVRVGTSFDYGLTVTNLGPSTAAELSLVDTLPAGASYVGFTGAGWACSAVTQTVTCTRTSLDNGASSKVTLHVTAAAIQGIMTNGAVVSAATTDPDNSNNATSTMNLATLVANLAVTISDSPDPVQGTISAGCSHNDCVTYTIAVSNAGPDAATGVKAVITLPIAGSFFNTVGSGWVCPAPAASTITCTRAASIAAAAAAPNITFIWKAPSPGGFSLVVTATASTTATDSDSSNNTASQDTTVLP